MYKIKYLFICIDIYILIIDLLFTYNTLSISFAKKSGILVEILALQFSFLEFTLSITDYFSYQLMLIRSLLKHVLLKVYQESFQNGLKLDLSEFFLAPFKSDQKKREIELKNL